MEIQNSFVQQDNVLIHKRLLDAPKELVWEVWTTPEHIKEWWGPEGFTLTTNSMEVQAGCAWDFTMHGWGKDWPNTINYLEVRKPDFLSYKHSGNEADYNFVVTVAFEDHGSKTLLTMTSIFKSKEIIDELNRKVNAIEGGKQTLNRLEQFFNKINK